MDSNGSTPRIISSPNAVTRIISIAQRAYKSVPFYQASLSDIDLTSPSLQLMNLPILTKEMARDAQKALARSDSLNRPDLITHYTSGSTGIPLRLIRTHTEIMRASQALWRARSEIFPEVINSPGVLVSASTFVPELSKNSKTVLLSTLDLRSDRVDSYLDMLDHYKPSWLFGHPALLGILAEGLKQKNRHLRTKLVFIETNSGWLAPETKNLLAEVFNCRIVNHYGSRETYTIAYECSKGTMHLLDECVVAELYPRVGIEESELIVSSLIFEVMPFIRYKIGDLVQPHSIRCTCGKTSSTLLRIAGRSSDFIAGTTLLGTYIFQLIVSRLARSGMDYILQYRVDQVEYKLFNVYLVLKDPQVLKLVSTSFQNIATAIVPDARFFFKAVDHIEPTKGGKVQSFTRAI